MSQIRNRFVAGAIVAAGLSSAAVALSGTASADPATPANPGLPGVNVVQQIANAAESALTGVAPAPATPPAPPAATASVSLPLPQSPSAALAPTGAATTAPTTPLNLPTIPGLPLSIPTDLAALIPSGVLPNLASKPVTAAANSVQSVPTGTATTGMQNPIAALLPFSALP